MGEFNLGSHRNSKNAPYSSHYSSTVLERRWLSCALSENGCLMPPPCTWLELSWGSIIQEWKDPGNERLIEDSRVCGVGNRYGCRQNSQSINLGGTNEYNTVIRLHSSHPESLKISLPLSFLPLSSETHFWESLTFLMETDLVSAPSISPGFLCNHLSCFLAVKCFCSPEDSPVSFYLSYLTDFFT